MSTRTNHACEGKEEGGVGGGTVSRGRGGAGRRGSSLVHLRDSRGCGVRGRSRGEVNMAGSPNFCLKNDEVFWPSIINTKLI